MKLFKPVVLTLSLSAYPILTFAFQSEMFSKESNETDSSYMSTMDNQANMKLTMLEKSLAKQWMLSESDWVKYKQIMSGPRGVWSPGLDPLTALGVSETDPRERKRYAEIWIKMETRRAELEIAFEVERMMAGKRINGNKKAINNDAWIRDWNKKYKEIDKQVLMFVDADCTKECREQFNDIYSATGNKSRLDIYFMSGATAEDIGKWASYMKIPTEEVRERRVTLNFDEGKSTSMEIDTLALPQVRMLDFKTGKVSKTFQ